LLAPLVSTQQAVKLDPNTETELILVGISSSPSGTQCNRTLTLKSLAVFLPTPAHIGFKAIVGLPFHLSCAANQPHFLSAGI